MRGLKTSAEGSRVMGVGQLVRGSNYQGFKEVLQDPFRSKMYYFILYIGMFQMESGSSWIEFESFCEESFGFATG